MIKELSVQWARCGALCCVTCVLFLGVAANRAAAVQGYVSRPCGFDLNFNGTAGEAADCHVCDGKTTDVDGNGVTDVLKYVDCQNGSDTTGTGTPGSPYKTIGKAMSVLGAPAAAQIQAVCFKGTCSETVTPTQSGAAGTYTRAQAGTEARSFDYPRYPFILSGWDINGDGDYPPHSGETAVLDGTIGGLSRTINMTIPRSQIEVAHFTAQNYANPCVAGGFMKSGSGIYIYVHDISLSNINSGCAGGQPSEAIAGFEVFNNPQVLAVENLTASGWSGYFLRGTGPYSDPAVGPWRFKNLTLVAGLAGTSASWLQTGFKFWGYVNGVEFLDSVFDANIAAWSATCATDLPNSCFTGSGGCGNNTAILVGQCARDVVVRNNTFFDWSVAVQVQAGATGYCDSPGRDVEGIVVDRNTIRIGGSGGNPYKCAWNTFGVDVTAVTSTIQSVRDITIIDNLFYSPVRVGRVLNLDMSHAAGSIVSGSFATVVGNTFNVDVYPSYAAIGIGNQQGSGDTGAVVDAVTVKDNIVSGSTPIEAVCTMYAPAEFAADGNVYQAASTFKWNHGTASNFTTWKTNSGQDAHSKTCAPSYVNAAGGDFHLASGDSCAKDAGINVSAITRSDIDGQTRPYGAAWDIGADEFIPSTVPPPPTLMSVVPGP